MALIAQMIGRNEADRFLEDVLKHLSSIADKIIFTDDCSDDDTLKIAEKYTSFTFQTERPMFAENEGRLRQEAWNNLARLAEPGDWVLAIDCDEKLWATSRDLSLDKLLHQKEYDVLNVRFHHMWNETQYRVDKAWAPHNSSRLFRFYYGGQFKERALACGSEPTYVQTLISRRKYMVDTGLIMQHLGYVRDEDKKAKYDRYMTLDHGDYHALNHIQSIIDPEPTLVDWDS